MSAKTRLTKREKLAMEFGFKIGQAYAIQKPVWEWDSMPKAVKKLFFFIGERQIRESL